jgi:hypothetical protein
METLHQDGADDVLQTRNTRKDNMISSGCRQAALLKVFTNV